MRVSEETAEEKAVYNETVYHFCSKNCRENFEKDPERYIYTIEILPKEQIKVAYFSMEIGLEAFMPTYSGGLGVLGGDTIRSAADLRVPMVAVSLLYRKGYFHQRLSADGRQTEEPVVWEVEEFLEEMPERAFVVIEGRRVLARSWRHEVEGSGGCRMPVYFLDTDLAENSDWDRQLTDFLYGGDNHYRLCQEVLLGIGGVRMLRSLGYDAIEKFHMNEGHAALLTMELLSEEAAKHKREKVIMEDVDAVRKKCIFTTHTPVPAGHDQFPIDLADRVLGKSHLHDLPDLFLYGGLLNMTHLTLNLCRYVNGVAKRHGEISRMMHAGYSIDAITNGVHAATWASRPFTALYDRYIPGWRMDNFSLRYALNIPKEEIWNAHMAAKEKLIQFVNQKGNAGMDADLFTIVFARRAATYKRGDLLLHDVERLARISNEIGRIQIIFAGKAHPKDEGGKEMIRKIFQAGERLKESIRIVYLSEYDLELGKLLVSGADIWLNTPQPPLEASGTSGMKAALNGVPSLSILDGWWIEGHIESVTGWAIGEVDSMDAWKGDSFKEADSLYNKLEKVILPIFYHDRGKFIEVMLHAIALNGSFFNTQRMMQQYVLNAYFR